MTQAQQEPVAWMVYTKDGQSVYVTDNSTAIQADQRALALYTSPPAQRPWVGLTLEIKMDMAESYFTDEWAINRAIQLLSECENALKEKNT